MNIETKTVRGDISDYLRFAWKHTEDTSYSSGRIHGTASVLARDKEMPNYKLISALEDKYFHLKSNIKIYKPISDNWELAVILFLLLVMPFAIYCIYKGKQKRKINENNNHLQIEMEKVLEEVKSLQ